MKVYIAPSSTCFWPFIFTTLVSSLGCTNSGVRTNRIMSKAHNGQRTQKGQGLPFWVSTVLNMQIFDAYIGHVFRFSDIIYDYQLVDLICVTLCRSIASKSPYDISFSPFQPKVKTELKTSRTCGWVSLAWANTAGSVPGARCRVLLSCFGFHNQWKSRRHFSRVGLR